MMKKNPLRFLGFLGLLGLAGLFTDNPGFYGFFGAFAFFAFANVKNDEMFRGNVEKAGLNGFIVSLAGVAATIAILSIRPALEVAAVLIAVIFILQLFTFIISFFLNERRGDI